MIVFELTGTENHPEYKALEYSNQIRQTNFLESVINAAVQFDRKFLSQSIIKALNYHAIACLHVNAGEYRPCEVTIGEYNPPEHYRVGALMDDFINIMNMNWEKADPFALSAYAYWRLNNIHPFINGNGRTARACCYFVLCVKSGGLLPGRNILPHLLHENRDQCISLLRGADKKFKEHKSFEEILTPLTDLLRDLVDRQLSSNERN